MDVVERFTGEQRLDPVDQRAGVPYRGIVERAFGSAPIVLGRVDGDGFGSNVSETITRMGRPY